MKQLKYDTAENEVRIDYPEEWKIEDLTAVSAVIKNTKGEVLQASTVATMYPATTLDGDVDRYSDEIILDSGATAPSVRDSLTLVGAGGTEVVRVKGYDPVLFKVTLEEPVQNEYSDTNVVYGDHAVLVVDTTDTDAFILGIQVQVIWTPTGTGTSTKELLDIAKYAMDLVSLRDRFKDLYERAYKAFTSPTDKFANMVKEAESEVKSEMLKDLMLYDRIVGQDITIQVVMAKMAFMWTFNGDDQIEDEREFLQERYNTKYAEIKALPIWTDTNQDDIKDENEVQAHEHFFGRNW